MIINILYFKGFRSTNPPLRVESEDLSFSESISRKNRIKRTPEEVEFLKDKLKHHLESNQSYMNSDLTIGVLSSELNIKKRVLSELINDHYDQNFIDFINDYRIEAAKNKLINSEDVKLTIQEVMYDVGFNSKSSFYTVFKKKTGLTPSEYKSKSRWTGGDQSVS